MVENKPKSKTLFLQSVSIDRIRMYFLIFISMFVYTHTEINSNTSHWAGLGAALSSQTPTMGLKLSINGILC